MKIRQFRYAADNLGYLIYGDQTAMAIDGGAFSDILAFVADNGLLLRYITNTHSHMDHTVGNQSLIDQTDARLLDFETLTKDGGLEIDGTPIRVYHTPGHTQDSICFYFDDVLISGDTLFNGKVGKCFTGDYEQFLASIKTLLKLPDATMVYAGHDYVEEYIAFIRALEPDNPHIDEYAAAYDPNHVGFSLGRERQVDPFLRFNDEKIIAILAGKGLPTDTESDRWRSLMSLM